MAVSGALLDPDTASAVTGPVWIAADPARKPPGGEQPRRHDQAVFPEQLLEIKRDGVAARVLPGDVGHPQRRQA